VRIVYTVVSYIKRFIKVVIKRKNEQKIDMKKGAIVMLQQVMTNPGEITFNEVSVPEITADQVLVKIMKNRCVRFGYPCVSWKTSVYLLSGYTGT